jgi:hypothetical protein
MALDPVTAMLDIGGKVIDRLFPDPNQAAAAKLELIRLQQSGELAQLAADVDVAKGQMAINEAEAASSSIHPDGLRACCRPAGAGLHGNVDRPAGHARHRGAPDIGESEGRGVTLQGYALKLVMAAGCR